MIIVRLKGGLGNQLFQYSLGRALAEKNQVELKLDTSWYGSIPDRKYELDRYAITGTTAVPEEVSRLRDSVLGKIANRFKPFSNRTVIGERFYHFDPEILRVGPDAYLEGYWQSEKYFSAIAPTIREELTLKAAMNEANKEMASQIQAATAPASLHVRRGDYVTSAAANQTHGVCSLDYYQEAVTKLAETEKNPTFFIFSDDPEWVKTNLKLKYPTVYVTHNDPSQGYEDVRLMSLCHHHVIANSSFSWWGAWLGTHEGQLVFAPKQWFQDSTNNDKDLIPKGWIRV